MKRISAILLIALFLFNLFGYRFVFNYVQQQSDQEVRVSLDNEEYNEADLVTIKVPLSLPYQSDQANFERVDGEVKFNGKIYKYVKRKIAEGQLVLLCLPDYKKMQIQDAKDDFYKNTNDLVQHNQSKKSEKSTTGAFKKALDYYINNSDISSFNYAILNKYNLFDDLRFLPSSPHISPEQPPEVI